MATLRVDSRFDSTGFTTGVKRMDKSVGTFSNRLVGVKTLIAGVFGGVLANGIRLVARATIIAASKFEDLALQFKVILGHGGKAKKLFADLVEFSAITPFSIEELSKASQQLLNFSEGALGGLDSMLLFGDAVQATNKDFEGSSYWIGRFYAALKSGDPIVDTTNALMRLKIMGPTVKKQLVDMKDSGESAAAMWVVFLDSLKKFEGGMAEMANTVSGKTSTMKDNWTKFMSAVGRTTEVETKKTIDHLTNLAKFAEKWYVLLQAGKHYGVAKIRGMDDEDATKYMRRMTGHYPPGMDPNKPAGFNIDHSGRAKPLPGVNGLEGARNLGKMGSTPDSDDLSAWLDEDAQRNAWAEWALEEFGNRLNSQPSDLKSSVARPSISVDQMQRAGGYTARVPGAFRRDKAVEMVRQLGNIDQRLQNIERNTRDMGVPE